MFFNVSINVSCQFLCEHTFKTISLESLGAGLSFWNMNLAWWRRGKHKLARPRSWTEALKKPHAGFLGVSSACVLACECAFWLPAWKENSIVWNVFFFVVAVWQLWRAACQFGKCVFSLNSHLFMSQVYVSAFDNLLALQLFFFLFFFCPCPSVVTKRCCLNHLQWFIFSYWSLNGENTVCSRLCPGAVFRSSVPLQLPIKLHSHLPTRNWEMLKTRHQRCRFFLKNIPILEGRWGKSAVGWRNIISANVPASPSWIQHTILWELSGETLANISACHSKLQFWGMGGKKHYRRSQGRQIVSQKVMYW